MAGEIAQQKTPLVRSGVSVCDLWPDFGLSRSAPAPRGVNKEYEKKKAERARAGREACLVGRVDGEALLHVRHSQE